jgi:hypothetical protein
MKNSQIILAFVTSSLIAVGTASGFIQQHVHFAGVANEMAVFALSGGFAMITGCLLISDAFKNVRNFCKK